MEIMQVCHGLHSDDGCWFPEKFHCGGRFQKFAF